MKIGLDLHGVSDEFPEFFAELSRLFVAAGHSVYVMTGELITDALHEQLKKCGVHYTHLYSIAQLHQDMGTPMSFDAKGTPWIDEDLWQQAKGKYAAEHGLDIVFDDTEGYAKHFTTPFLFCKNPNKKRS